MDAPETANTVDTDLILKLVASSAYAAWHNTLIGNGPPSTKHYFKRMHEPQPGDLVLEISNWIERPIDRIGRLLSVGMEDPPEEVVSKANYDEEEWGRPYPPYQERIFRIRTLDGREYRWWNADFIVIPEDPFKHPGRILAERDTEIEG